MRIQAALVSSTPTKDTPGALRTLVNTVGPEVWALTGKECADLCEAAIDFVVRFTQLEAPRSHKDLQGLLFLVNPAGEFVGVWPVGVGPVGLGPVGVGREGGEEGREGGEQGGEQGGDVAEDIAGQVRAWKQRHSNWLGPWGPHSIKPRVA